MALSLNFVLILMGVSLLVNLVSAVHQQPNELVEYSCKQTSGDFCSNDPIAKISVINFHNCWNTHFDQCVRSHPGGATGHRDDLNCTPQDHVVNVCYQDSMNDQICTDVVYEVL